MPWPISQRAADMENDTGKVDKGMRSDDAAKLEQWRNDRKKAAKVTKKNKS